MRPILDVMAVLAEGRRLASELVRAREEIAELRRRVPAARSRGGSSDDAAADLEHVRSMRRRWHPNDLILSALVAVAAVVFALAALG